ncbi:N-acetyltransferase [Nitrococcus mobilis]|uniref:N-acetyltransferase domain-containing protein n=1 Tax=Nitrococcus mobilis Nb-231 TaxID=314278 RepID=A4BVF9_9GAMM|nr:N-acetyltransferase [Nitrococcus mobilis]EAR20279.1 hypothetical protein NB231_13631 [Nitrococcus mobilis Nb-231]
MPNVPYGILGQAAPELVVIDWIDGQGQPRAPWQLADHSDAVRVIYCFQAWCPGCHSSGFPTLQALTAEYTDRGVQFAVIQTVFEGHDANGAAQRRVMQRRYGLALPFGQDDARPRPATMTAYRTGGTPWWLVIDQQGRVIYNDFHWRLDLARRTLDAALEGTGKPPEVREDTLVHDEAGQRFVLKFHDGGEGELVYRRHEQVLELVHTEVPADRRGQGLGARLMERALEAIEAQGFKVRPVCSYTRHYLQRYKRWAPLLS